MRATNNWRIASAIIRKRSASFPIRQTLLYTPAGSSFVSVSFAGTEIAKFYRTTKFNDVELSTMFIEALHNYLMDKSTS